MRVNYRIKKHVYILRSCPHKCLMSRLVVQSKLYKPQKKFRNKVCTMYIEDDPHVIGNITRNSINIDVIESC